MINSSGSSLLLNASFELEMFKIHESHILHVCYMALYASQCIRHLGTIFGRGGACIKIVVL